MRVIAILGLMVFLSFNSSAKKEKTRVKYKKSKRIDFESLLIEGEKKKADYSVVTGNIGEKDFGLLKLRDNFIDNMSDDAGEVLQ